MGNSKEYKPVENIQDYVLDTSPEHVWELEDELLKLRIENAFKTLMCGIERMNITNHKKNEIRQEIFESIKQTHGKKLILAPGCVIRYPLDDDMLSYIKKVKVEIEQTIVK